MCILPFNTAHEQIGIRISLTVIFIEQFLVFVYFCTNLLKFDKIKITMITIGIIERKMPINIIQTKQNKSQKDYNEIILKSEFLQSLDAYIRHIY